MTNLASFAELVKAANEDKKRRQEEETATKVKEITPLLSELFSTVAKAKEVQQTGPLIAELESALINPEQVHTEKKQKILDLVTELETKATEVENNQDSTQLEKKFLKLFNRLQSDFQNLKKYVETKGAGSVAYSGGGSGEVRILRMDDVVKTTPPNGSVMTWNATLNKFEFKMPSTSGGTTVTDEEMPYSKRVDFISDDVLYKGEAQVGSPENSAVWRIRKVTIGLDNDVTEVWASGTAEYDKRWDARVSYFYS